MNRDDLMTECQQGHHGECEGESINPGPVAVCGCSCHHLTCQGYMPEHGE